MKHLIIFFAVLGLLLTSTVMTQVPNKISYQGLLTASSGTPLLNGSYDITFKIFNTSSGGAPLWTQNQDNVEVNRGTFSVILFPLTPSFSISFNQPLWVEITVTSGPGISAPITFSPRSELTSAPFAIRSDTANNVTSENGNLFIGRGTGASNTSGGNNVFIGDSAGYSNDLGMMNTFVGVSAGYHTATNFGRVNTFVGYQAGYSNVDGDANVFVGKGAGMNNNSIANTFVGHHAGVFNTAGHNNTLIGENTGTSIHEGVENTIVGSDASCQVASDGSYNSFFGFAAGFTNAGNHNTFIGWLAGENSNIGGNNTCIGSMAGRYNGSGNNNTFVGYNAGADSNLTNATAVGANAHVAASNALVLGNNTNVGIGTTAPGSLLHIQRPYATANPMLILQNTTESAGENATKKEFRHATDGRVQAWIGDEPRTGNPPVWRTNLHFATASGINNPAIRMTIDPNGNVGIGTTSPSVKFQVGSSGDGTSALANAWNTFSSRRWKTNIKPLEHALGKVQ